MRRYKAIKEFIYPYSFNYINKGEEIIFDEYSETKIIETLLTKHKFIEEIPEQPKTVYDLKEGDVCYQISGTIISRCEWKNCEGLILKRSVGDITLTKEEAEKKVAWREAREIIIQDTKGFKPKFGKGKCIDSYGWEIEFDVEEQELKCLPYRNQEGTIRFATEEDAEVSIRVHPQEWKTYLGVEE